LNDPLIGGTPSVLERLIEVFIQAFLNLNPARMPPKILSGGRLDVSWGNIESIIGYRFCCGVLLAGLQAEVAAIIFPPASSPDVVNFTREREALLTQGFFS
jgi:hypothetical protein